MSSHFVFSWSVSVLLLCLLLCFDQGQATTHGEDQLQNQGCPPRKAISVNLWSLKDSNSQISRFPTAVLTKPPDATGALDEFFVQALPGIDDYWPFLGNATGPRFDSYFAARFDSELCLDIGRAVEFVVHSDDGSVLYVDGNVVVSMNQPQSIASKRSEVTNLSSGCHKLQLHLFQNDGASLAKVEMADVNAAGDVSNVAVLTAPLLSPPEAFGGCADVRDSVDLVAECTTPELPLPCDPNDPNWFFNARSGLCELGSCDTAYQSQFLTREDCRMMCVEPVKEWASYYKGPFECYMPNTDAIVNHTCHCKPRYSGETCRATTSRSTGRPWGSSTAIMCLLLALGLYL